MELFGAYELGVDSTLRTGMSAGDIRIKIHWSVRSALMTPAKS